MLKPQIVSIIDVASARSALSSTMRMRHNTRSVTVQGRPGSDLSNPPHAMPAVQSHHATRPDCRGSGPLVRGDE